MKNKLENSLKNSFAMSNIQTDQHHFQTVVAVAHNELSKKEKRKRIKFSAFLVSQIKFTAWKIWMVQGLILVVLCSVLSACFGDLFLSRPQHIAILLCGSAIVVLMTAMPFIQRGLRYKMYEIEVATKFSSIKLLSAKLLIIGIGDAIMLSSVLLLALFKTTLTIGTIALYLMLPFLVLTSVCLYVLGHVPVHRFSLYCGSGCAAIFLIVAGFRYLYPEIVKQTFSVSWSLICIALVMFCVYQLRYIMRHSTYAEAQFA
ncbi:MAG: hypothetical protein RSF40_09030 [Oscillospiraceae bacterium]